MILHSASLRRTARIICIAAAFSLLIGCTPASPSSSNKASVSGALTQPDNDSVLVMGGSQTGSEPSGEENALPVEAVAGLEDALNNCLGWGPGSAGCSLHSVAAAAALLDWSSENALAAYAGDPAASAFDAWYAELDEFDRDTFAETWPMVCDDAAALLEDTNSMAGLLETAGASTENAGDWNGSDWETLRAAIDGGSGC